MTSPGGGDLLCLACRGISPVGEVLIPLLSREAHPLSQPVPPAAGSKPSTAVVRAQEEESAYFPAVEMRAAVVEQQPFPRSAAPKREGFFELSRPREALPKMKE